MPDPAEQVARRLTAYFLEHGNFTQAGANSAGAGAVPAALADAGEEYAEDLEIAGLAVDSVGYEPGAEQPTVHVYLTKASRAAERQLATPQGEVKIVTHYVGNLVVRPELRPVAGAQGKVYEHNGKIACGSSCSPSNERSVGTFGALVKIAGDDAFYMLSNNHVLAGCNHVPVGMPIMSPSPLCDGGGNQPHPRTIAEHAKIVAIRSGAPALVDPIAEDVALAEVFDPQLVSSWQGTVLDGYDTPTDIKAPEVGMRVKRFGRTTGHAAGTVQAFIQGPRPIPYKSSRFAGIVWYRNHWTVLADPGTHFALPGDSGSLVVNEDASAAVGLLFAASPKGNYGMMFPMDHIVTLFGGLTLVSDHGV